MVWDMFDPQPTASFATDVGRPSNGAQQPTHQCVYDENPIELYKRIENAEWKAITYFLDNGSWPGFSLLPDYNPKYQAMTVVIQFDRQNGNPFRVRWKRLPLHQAVRMNAPFSVVHRLFKLYPDSVRWADGNGNLPIHYALFFEASDDIVAFLLMRYPDSIYETNKLGFTPIQSALKARSRARGLMLSVFAKYTKPRSTSSSSSENSNTPTKKFECDYHRDCTELFKKIEEGKWGVVCDYLDTGYWADSVSICNIFGVPDEISPEEQARTWVTRRDRRRGDVLRSQLPIHLCLVLGAPASVIRRILECYPKAVFCPDDEGLLPIHLALYHQASNAVVASLLLGYPESVNQQSINGLTPLDCALCATDNVRGKILESFTSKASLHRNIKKASSKTSNKAEAETKSIKPVPATIVTTESRQESIKIKRTESPESGPMTVTKANSAKTTERDGPDSSAAKTETIEPDEPGAPMVATEAPRGQPRPSTHRSGSKGTKRSSARLQRSRHRRYQKIPTTIGWK